MTNEELDAAVIRRATYRGCEAWLYTLQKESSESGHRLRGPAAEKGKLTFKQAMREAPSKDMEALLRTSPNTALFTALEMWWLVLARMGWTWGKGQDADPELRDQIEERWSKIVTEATDHWLSGVPEQVTYHVK